MYFSHSYTNQGPSNNIMWSLRLWNFPSQYVKVHLSFMYIFRCFQIGEFDWNLETYWKYIDIQSNSNWLIWESHNDKQPNNIWCSFKFKHLNWWSMYIWLRCSCYYSFSTIYKRIGFFSVLNLCVRLSVHPSDILLARNSG
jgi:hypothetical protein